MAFINIILLYILNTWYWVSMYQKYTNIDIERGMHNVTLMVRILEY